jgi:D-psicose/D-tagatose/L-ribulose 3-epimerase
MIFGVNTWVWFSPTTTERFAQVVPKARAMGFDAVEFGIEATDALDYREAAVILAEHGCGVSVAAAMSPERDLLADDAVVRRHARAYLEHCIDACHTLGADNLVGPMYSAVGRVWQDTPESRARHLDTLASALTELAGYAADRGVTLCIEPLNRFETSFVNTAEQAVEIVDRVDHPNCGILLDTFHMGIEEKSLGNAIRRCGPRLRHLHACGNDRGAPGNGHLPWDEVAAALIEIGYRGPVVIESFTAEVRSIARAAAVWRPFEASQDDLARDGLVFLKRLLA